MQGLHKASKKQWLCCTGQGSSTMWRDWVCGEVSVAPTLVDASDCHDRRAVHMLLALSPPLTLT